MNSCGFKSNDFTFNILDKEAQKKENRFRDRNGLGLAFSFIENVSIINKKSNPLVKGISDQSNVN